MTKTEIAELKAYVFALYYGQKVLIHKHEFGVYNGTIGFNSDTSQYLNNSYLQLRELSGISDIEAIEVAKIVCARHNRHYKLEEIAYSIKRPNYEIWLEVKGHKKYIVQITCDGIAFIDAWMGGAGSKHYYAPGQYLATDGLRGFGIALDVFYKGVHYSVEQLIEKGIVKIINQV